MHALSKTLTSNKTQLLCGRSYIEFESIVMNKMEQAHPTFADILLSKQNRKESESEH